LLGKNLEIEFFGKINLIFGREWRLKGYRRTFWMKFAEKF